MEKRVLLMISTDPLIFREGSAVRARQIEYAKSWDEVHIVVLQKRSQSDRRETVIANNCWAYSTHSLSKALAPLVAIRIGRFLVERRRVSHITCQDPFLTAIAGVSLKKCFPVVQLEIQLHTDIASPHFTYTFGNKARKALALSHLPKADRIRAVSTRMSSYLIESLGIDPTKIEVRPIKVDVERVKLARITPDADLHKKFPQFKKIVLMASRLEPEKNIALAISAWKVVVSKLPGTGLVIVGSGSQMTRLKRVAEKDDAKNSIVFMDWVDQETLYSYYKTADAFLNTSLYEGYGMTLVEAHAAGCPVISTDVGVARDVGARIVGWDATSLHEGIVDLLSSADRG